MTAGGDQDWEPLIASDTLEAAPSLSRDGDWIAYASNRSGRCEIYAERYPGLSDRTQVSTQGGAEALWSPTRDELYFREGSRLLAVSVDLDNGLDPGDPEVVADGLPPPACGVRSYDVSADGEKFIFAKPVGSVDGSDRGIDLVLVQNWFQELERRVPTR
jgi:hypothetical protein